MKKIILSLVLVFVLIAPMFAEETSPDSKQVTLTQKIGQKSVVAFRTTDLATGVKYVDVAGGFGDLATSQAATADLYIALATNAKESVTATISGLAFKASGINTKIGYTVESGTTKYTVTSGDTETAPTAVPFLTSTANGGAQVIGKQLTVTLNTDDKNAASAGDYSTILTLTCSAE